MKAADIFAGPILRRAQAESVWIWIATTKPITLEGAVRLHGSDSWATTSSADRITVFEDALFVHLIKVEPEKGGFPMGKLLEYSLGVVKADGSVDHAPFQAIVEEDGLAYPETRLPTFFIQLPGAKLNALYASCRKMHDIKGGASDALSFGDSYVFNNAKVLSARPAVLCLTGDQIYADDVHDDVFDQIASIAKKLEGTKKETLPKGLAVPSKGNREDWVVKYARFTANQAMSPTSKPAKNHLVTFAEFAAMYGMAFSARNWPAGTPTADLSGYVSGLPAVRRLLANTPTYMMFDDHDVTDDWNFSINWSNNVSGSDVGSRIVGNALYAYWLFQAWGNDPVLDEAFVPQVIVANAERLSKPALLQSLLLDKSKAHGDKNTWEFFTPTVPIIYFLDTRTQRGCKDWEQSDTSDPAFLKSRASWKSTVGRLQGVLAKQSRTLPLVLASPAPIFGFEWIDKVQAIISSPVAAGSYRLDKEGWAANDNHLKTFLLLCADRDVVVLSGDVHYSYSSTALFSVFDSPFLRDAIKEFGSKSFPVNPSSAAPSYEHLYSSRFLQLTASASKNYAFGPMAHVSKWSGQFGHIMNYQGRLSEGVFKNPDLYEKVVVPVANKVVFDKVDLAKKKPLAVFHQKVNDANNVRYIDKHNIGIVSILGRRVDNAFLVDGKAQSSKSWDFATSGAWEPSVT